MAIDIRQPDPAPVTPEPMPAGRTDAPAPWPRRVATNPTTVAVVVWLLALPVAVALPSQLHLDPFAQRSWSLSLGVGFAGIAALLAVGLFWAGRRGAATAMPILCGVGAGLLAAWVALALRVCLTATPYGFGGLLGDAGRQTAMATRYSVTIASSDAWIPGLPGEYPPLFFWLTGRAGALLDTPAWRLIGDAEVLVTSSAAVAGFALWRRLVSPWAALAIAGLALVAFGDPRKAYEVITLVVFLPWALATFGRPPRGRLHWLAAGFIGGLIVLTYQAWLVFGGLGLLALAVHTSRASADRRRYLLHLVGVAGVAAVVSSWYVLPYLWATLTRPTRRVADLYAPGSLQKEFLPFLAATPLGVLQLVGLAGLVVLRRSVWWATPLLLITAGTLLFRVLATLRFALTGHTGFLHYSTSLYSVALVAAGVLTLVHAGPLIPARLSATLHAGAAAVALALAFVCYTYSATWTPAAAAPSGHYTAEAHLEALPGGGYPGFAPRQGRAKPFPADAIRDAVARTLGPDARPVTLSVDERLYAFLPWPGYTSLASGAAGSLVQWDRQQDVIRQLSATADPAAFAAASADTEFGPIDVFVLRRDHTRWKWRDQVFTAQQFDVAHWAVDTDLPDDIVVATRR